jgi:mono/diheme cytochrome c family protein
MRQFATMMMVAISLSACRQGSSANGASSSDAQNRRSSGLNRQDELLLAAANVALPPPGTAPADLPEPNSRGAVLIAQYCGQCHNIPAPQMHSATDWPGIARRMWLRMELLPASQQVKVPTAAERFTILEYLNANALQVSGSSLPPGRGREAFAQVCSRCHALPDPRVHSRDDWPAVFSRMERNMERMQVPSPSREQTTDILLYLQMVASRQ